MAQKQQPHGRGKRSPYLFILLTMILLIALLILIRLVILLGIVGSLCVLRILAAAAPQGRQTQQQSQREGGVFRHVFHVLFSFGGFSIKIL